MAELRLFLAWLEDLTSLLHTFAARHVVRYAKVPVL